VQDFCLGFEINENKTNITREQPQINQTRNIQIGDYKFKKVHNSKYLGTELKSQNNNHEEIKKRVLAGNTLSKCLR